MSIEIITKHAALILAKIAPAVGVFTVIASIETSASGFQESPWTTMWRIALSAALGIFITLVGAIYHSIDRRMISLEKRANDDLVPRREHDNKMDNMRDRLELIERDIRSRKK